MGSTTLSSPFSKNVFICKLGMQIDEAFVKLWVVDLNLFLVLGRHVGLVQVANEAPADIKSNLTRAWANFDQEKINSCNKPTEYKACLFSLCWFHSIVLGENPRVDVCSDSEGCWPTPIQLGMSISFVLTHVDNSVCWGWRVIDT